MTLSPHRRITGVICLCAGLLVIPAYARFPQLSGVLIPLSLIAGAWLITGAGMAVAITTALLAGLASDRSGTWVSAGFYPALAISAGVLAVFLLARRFRQRIQATRDARWAPRRGIDRRRIDSQGEDE
ncbi:MAG: hypothetical protein AAF513_09260 [Pseudomonadota bacterium]